MHKPNMANSLGRILVLAAVISGIMFAGPAEAQDPPADSGPKPGDGGGSNPGVLPIPTAPVGDSKVIDANNRAVTQGLVGLISPLLWPATFSFLKAFDFILRVFIGQKLPCTLWSLAPPRMKCTKLE